MEKRFVKNVRKPRDEEIPKLECVHQKIGKMMIGIGPCFVPNRNWSMSRNKSSKNPFR